MTDAAAQQNKIRDFTLTISPHQFRIDEDIFVAPGILSPITMRKLANLHGTLGDRTQSSDLDGALSSIAEMFRLLLSGPSGQRFAERLFSETEPIDLTRQALPVLYWLLEEYGLRPTQPSSDSSDSSTQPGTDTPSDGTSSTDGA